MKNDERFAAVLEQLVYDHYGKNVPGTHIFRIITRDMVSIECICNTFQRELIAVHRTIKEILFNEAMASKTEFNLQLTVSFDIFYEICKTGEFPKSLNINVCVI